jgi:hypothetical protein
MFQRPQYVYLLTVTENTVQQQIGKVHESMTKDPDHRKNGFQNTQWMLFIKQGGAVQYCMANTFAPICLTIF